MSAPGTASLAPLFRLLLRASLLGGAAFDFAVALVLLAAPWLATSEVALATSLLGPEPALYSWLTVPPLIARGAVQGFACYDRPRYDRAILWTGATLLLTAALAYPAAPRGVVVVAGLLGVTQLGLRRVARV